uniref:ShKT domain-containing protein n=1 Tax=Panagrolaimus sp. ES5 TaxID=591445 RepID=A0AC34FWC3_9BILA
MKLFLAALLVLMLEFVGAQYPGSPYSRCSYCYYQPYSSGYGGYRGGYGGGYGAGYGAGLNTAAGLCRDRSPNCAYLVSVGECATNPLVTRTMCPISCGTGCNYAGGIGAGLGTGLGLGGGLGYGTMDSLADNSIYSSSLLYNGLSPYSSGIYKREPRDKIVSRPAAEAK